MEGEFLIFKSNRLRNMNATPSAGGSQKHRPPEAELLGLGGACRVLQRDLLLPGSTSSGWLRTSGSQGGSEL